MQTRLNSGMANSAQEGLHFIQKQPVVRAAPLCHYQRLIIINHHISQDLQIMYPTHRVESIRKKNVSYQAASTI